MAEVVLFHHVRGLTDGLSAWADVLQAAGHRVTAPDLFAGARFDTTEAGVAHAESIGFEAIAERGVEAAAQLPDPLVAIGFSLGALPTQKLAQTRFGVCAAVLFHSVVPPDVFGGWPGSVAVQVHMMADDPLAEEDRAAADELVAVAPDAELFVYPGANHLFADSSLPEYDPEAAELARERTLGLLARWP